MIEPGRLIPVIVCDAIIIIACFVRFWCKLKLKTGFHGDDWWTLLTVTSFIGAEVALFWGIIHGNRDGKTIGEVNHQLQTATDPVVIQKLQNFLKSIFIAVTISFFVLYAIKIAILLLYRRIFSTSGYRLASNILIAVSTVWFIVIESINLAHCQPLESFWTDYDLGSCINFNVMFFAGGLVEVFIDVAIIIIPIVAVYKLNAKLRTKMYISAIFLLGWFSIITNILRIYYSYQPHQRFVNLQDAELWTVIHICSAVLCACIPVYKPIRTVVHNMGAKVLKYISTTKQSFSGASKRSRTASFSYQMDSVGTSNNHPERPRSTHESQKSTRDLLEIEAQHISDVERS
jgi:hypothetical protein